MLAVVIAGCGVSLRMLAVDDVERRVRRVEDAAKALEASAPPEDISSVPTMDAKAVNNLAGSILYECQELLSWIGALTKDVGSVPRRRKLALDTAAERDTQFEYIVESGARASKRARRRKAVASLPGRIIGWTVRAVWNVLPWWVKLPALAAFAAWVGGTVYIYLMRVRAARAAAQGEAALARLQKYVDAEKFVEAVDAGHNPDLARVHEKQKRAEVKAAQKKAARKVAEEI